MELGNRWHCLTTGDIRKILTSQNLCEFMRKPISTSTSPWSSLVFSGWQFPMLPSRAVNIYIIIFGEKKLMVVVTINTKKYIHNQNVMYSTKFKKSNRVILDTSPFQTSARCSNKESEDKGRSCFINTRYIMLWIGWEGAVSCWGTVVW